MKQNVKSAAKKLPKEIREIFLDTWEMINLMDLYEGDLKIYFELIREKLNDKNKRIEELEEGIRNINRKLTK